MSRCRLVQVWALSLLASVVAITQTRAQTQSDAINPPPTPAAWAALAKHPDWGGVWTPDLRNEFAEAKGNPPPWTPAAAK